MTKRNRKQLAWGVLGVAALLLGIADPAVLAGGIMLLALTWAIMELFD